STEGTFAQEQYCNGPYSRLSSDQCKTVGAGAAVSTGSGIYSMKKYSQANSIEQQYTVRLYTMTADDRIGPPIAAAASSIADGDKVTIGYQLNEAENRAYHIDLMEQKASSARSSASYHQVQAMTAMKTDYNDKGEVVGQSPDWSARAMHAASAASEEAAARKYDSLAQAARNGGKVPIYDFDEVIESTRGNASETASFVNKHIATGGKITAIAKLPAEKFALVKSAIKRGRAGLAGVAAGAAVAVEEVVEGAVARKIERRRYAPAIETYGRNGGSN
ncbi:MAG TPA: hypothetical protein VFV50_14805, partial [Bdellovibrionales bacterium]|nr:hypothetical protein [Bdellovibrionales bacterium]